VCSARYLVGIDLYLTMFMLLKREMAWGKMMKNLIIIDVSMLLFLKALVIFSMYI
jgi:hypothetical protein